MTVSRSGRVRHRPGALRFDDERPMSMLRQSSGADADPSAVPGTPVLQGRHRGRGSAVRDVPAVLADWRSAERELDSAHDDQIRAALAARIDVLRLEHAAALEQLDVEANERSRYPAPKRPPSE